MRIYGIVGRSGRKAGATTTRPATVAPDIPDLVRRDFDVDDPDTVWCTDLTYVPTADGWLYLVTIIDAASRRDDHPQATKEIHRYIRWHNTKRRHSALDYLAPDTWERAHTMTLAA